MAQKNVRLQRLKKRALASIASFGLLATMFPAVASSATATQAPASSHSAKPASVASNLATQNQASTNAAMAPARVNSSVCAPNTSFGILESGQLLKINTADGTTQNLGSTNLRATYPLSGMDLGYDVAWVRKQQVNGLGAVSYTHL